MKKLDKKFTIRFNMEDFVDLYRQAEATGLSVADFLRKLALGRRIVSKFELRTLGELRKLGGLLKHIHNQTNGAYSHETIETLRAIEAAARAIENSIEK